MDQPVALLLLEQTRTVSNFYLSPFSSGHYGGFCDCLVSRGKRAVLCQGHWDTVTSQYPKGLTSSKITTS